MCRSSCHFHVIQSRPAIKGFSQPSFYTDLVHTDLNLSSFVAGGSGCSTHQLTKLCVDLIAGADVISTRFTLAAPVAVGTDFIVHGLGVAKAVLFASGLSHGERLAVVDSRIHLFDRIQNLVLIPTFLNEAPGVLRSQLALSSDVELWLLEAKLINIILHGLKLATDLGGNLPHVQA